MTLLLTLLGFSAFFPLRAQAQQSGTTIPDEIVVGVNPTGVPSVNPAAALENGIGHITRVLPQLHAYRIKLQPGMTASQAIARLRLRPGVRYAEPNHIRRLFATPNDPGFAGRCEFRTTSFLGASWDGVGQL